MGGSSANRMVCVPTIISGPLRSLCPKGALTGGGGASVQHQFPTTGRCEAYGVKRNRTTGWPASTTSGSAPVATVSVRYIVNNVDAAIAFYCQHLGFHEQMHPAPTFAMLTRGDLRLVLSAAGGGPGGGQAMPDGTVPTPGGWNRFSIEIADLTETVETLRAAGVHLRSEPIAGVGGKQVVIDDPSGNPVELFEPTRAEARLDDH